MSDGLVFEQDIAIGLAVLTIDRPASKNAFTAAMWAAGAEFLHRIAGDDRLRVLLVNATSDVFSAGADIKDFQSSKDAGRPFHNFLDEFTNFPKPIVGAVNGAAVGSGFTILAYVDVLLASRNARFRAPFVQMGLVPEAGSSRMLPELLGWQAAADLMFTSGWLSAEEAFRLGFVRELVDPEELQGLARARAEHIASMPLESLMATKLLLLDGRTGIGEVRQRESALFRERLASREEHQ
jgi:enoyl-CoA hydratase/carnithine racemase